MKISKVCIRPAKCSLDIGDGSERSAYVNQDYMLRRLGRPHRGISLMYCYYPLDKEWPQRISEAWKDRDVKFAWDYPYDDYFPYGGGIDGNTEGEPFVFMKDVRKHGQDVILTITCDPHISDEHIIAIAKDLRPYGRMMLRINHEATGTWFSFNKRAGYQEVADFFVRFHRIIKEYAPNVSTVLCIGSLAADGSGKVEKEEEFTEAIRTADIWSVDEYVSLNWGWPYEIATKDTTQHRRRGVREVYQLVKDTYHRFTEINGGVAKPMVMSEFNTDADVVGVLEQAEDVREFYQYIREDEENWLSGITFYQFRDDGRLGLEMTDFNNSGVGIEQPVMKAYKEILGDKYFYPDIRTGENTELPAVLRWGSSEDAEGIAVDIELDGNPHYAEAYFEGTLAGANLIMEINGQWFYKAPGVKYIDFMPAFFDNSINGKKTVKLNIFAPPAEGVNDEEQGDDWIMNYYYTMTELPKMRFEFEPVVHRP